MSSLSLFFSSPQSVSSLSLSPPPPPPPPSRPSFQTHIVSVRCPQLRGSGLSTHTSLAGKLTVHNVNGPCRHSIRRFLQVNCWASLLSLTARRDRLRTSTSCRLWSLPALFGWKVVSRYVAEHLVSEKTWTAAVKRSELGVSARRGGGGTWMHRF